MEEVFITTLWDKPHTIVRANYKNHDSYVYAVTWSQAAAREANEENGEEEEEDEEDNRTETEKAVQKGICCTGVRFTRVTYGEEHWYTGIHTATGQGSFAKFQSGVRIRLSRKDPVEDGRRNASIKIHSKKSGTLYFDHRNVFPADVEDGEWRMDFVPNESALDNVLKSIRIVASAETTPLQTLSVKNRVTLS